jgi:predicted anti-sigma-YlaC factor YlaD
VAGHVAVAAWPAVVVVTERAAAVAWPVAAAVAGHLAVAPWPAVAAAWILLVFVARTGAMVPRDSINTAAPRIANTFIGLPQLQGRR